MNAVDIYKRKTRLKQASGMNIHEIISRGLVTRKDWVDLAGARYPNNGHLWGRKLNGKIRYVGFIPAHKKDEIAVDSTK